jgi:hypothetical protein
VVLEITRIEATTELLALDKLAKLGLELKNVDA